MKKIIAILMAVAMLCGVMAVMSYADDAKDIVPSQFGVVTYQGAQGSANPPAMKDVDPASDTVSYKDNTNFSNFMFCTWDYYYSFVILKFDSAVTIDKIIGASIYGKDFESQLKWTIYAYVNGAWKALDTKATYDPDDAASRIGANGALDYLTADRQRPSEVNDDGSGKGWNHAGRMIYTFPATESQYFAIYLDNPADITITQEGANNFVLDGNFLYGSSSGASASADTGDMLNVAIAVASVAILGTAAAIVIKRRKED